MKWRFHYSQRRDVEAYYCEQLLKATPQWLPSGPAYWEIYEDDNQANVLLKLRF